MSALPFKIHLACSAMTQLPAICTYLSAFLVYCNKEKEKSEVKSCLFANFKVPCVHIIFLYDHLDLYFAQSPFSLYNMNFTYQNFVIIAHFKANNDIVRHFGRPKKYAQWKKFRRRFSISYHIYWNASLNHLSFASEIIEPILANSIRSRGTSRPLRPSWL